VWLISPAFEVTEGLLRHHLKQVAGEFGLVHADDFRVFAQL
jgi:hypothetical protein